MKKTVFIVIFYFLFTGCAQTNEQSRSVRKTKHGLPVKMVLQNDQGLPVEVQRRSGERIPVELKLSAEGI